ncbi:HEAT repeat domain-containing protein [Actinocatenispora sera]|uniref:HEAT repeat domain-containing protein n=1 Tax=Actinocatenispora sera TaxID=390989 RepID=UPI003404F760
MGATPAELARATEQRLGTDEMVARCVALLQHGDPFAEVEFIVWLAGASAENEMRLRTPEDDPSLLYWPRVWAARALVYVWDDAAIPAVLDALGDRAWRVREMAAKVVISHEIGAAGDRLVPLLSDPVPRVRIAAARALGVVGEAEHAPALREAVADDQDQVVARAEAALRAMSRRLDRNLLD